MIAELSLTLYFVCSQPVYVIAELGGETNGYPIIDHREENGRIIYSIKNPDLFYNKVMRQMMIRNKPHRFIRKECYES